MGTRVKRKILLAISLFSSPVLLRTGYLERAGGFVWNAVCCFGHRCRKLFQQALLKLLLLSRQWNSKVRQSLHQSWNVQTWGLFEQRSSVSFTRWLAWWWMYAGVMSAEFENHFKTRFTYAEEYPRVKKKSYMHNNKTSFSWRDQEILDLLKVQQMLKWQTFARGQQMELVFQKTTTIYTSIHVPIRIVESVS